MCVCVCIISHPAVPCLSPPFYPCTCLTFRGVGELLLVCWYTLHIYPLLPVEFQSVIVLAPSQTCIYTYKSLHLFVPSPAGFSFFFPTRCVLRHRPVFFFFSPVYCFQFFCFIAFFWVCLFVYYLIQNQKEIKSFEILGAARGDMLRL